MSSFPERIVCLTEETTETLYLLGEQDRIVGVSGYTVRPPEARGKPKVSAFTSARFDKIEALEPDLVLAFSDLQADLAAELVKRGISVMTFNQRSVAEILQMIRMLGGLVGRQIEASALADRLSADLDRIRDSAARFPRRLRAFFDSFEHAEADFAARLLIEARNEAESVIAATEKTLRAPEFAQVARTDLAEGEQARIESALADTKAVLGSTDRETIQARTHALNDATRHLAEVMMNRSVQAALAGRSVDDVR